MEAELEPLAKKSKLHEEENGNIEDDCIKPDIGDIEVDITNDISDVSSDIKENSSYETSVNENEEKYGISVLVNKNKRLSGIIKQRYSDFMVRECDTDGNLVYLMNLNHVDTSLDQGKPLTIDCPITDEVVLQKIKDFVHCEDKTKTLVLETDNDKEHRKLVHKYIKDSYKDIETDTTVLEDGSRAIKLFFKSNNAHKQNRKPGWPKDLPKYCHFVLFKENRDTMECINVLAKLVHGKASNFSYAGTKDRRATTIQRVAVQNIYSKQLSNLNSRLKNMAVGNFSYRNEGLSLGCLSGNHFTIVIRNLNETDEQINMCCKSLKDEGFVNYFGLQRFGTGAIPTHSIGKVLLQKKFEEAINLILQFNADEVYDRFEAVAKKIWHQTKDARKALSAVRSRTSIEGKLLEKLSKQTKYNYYNAFMALPRNNRLMYLHSFQSVIWNNMVTKRIQGLGTKPCIGDLIVSKTKGEDGHAVVRALTDEDINMETFTIYDIVLPLPGYDVVYPSNEIARYYRQALSSDGIDIDNMKNNIKEISLPGTYRNIMVRPKDVSWKIQKYDDYKIPLISTDLEKIHDPENANKHLLEDTCIEGRYKAVVLDMTLSSSCYATSALREVLIADSSYKSQVTLNEKFRRNDSKCTENPLESK